MAILVFSYQFGTIDGCLKNLKSFHGNETAYCSYGRISWKLYSCGNSHRNKSADCGRMFQVTTDTVFEYNTIKMLSRWINPIYFKTAYLKVITSNQLAYPIEVTQQTAQLILRLIRSTISTGELHFLSGSDAVINETHKGGKEQLQ